MEDTDESDPPSASEDFSENDEAENTQMNNSSLLEKTDIENKMTEIPLETIIPSKANTVKCIHCGKSYTSRGITKKSLNFILKYRFPVRTKSGCISLGETSGPH